MCVTVVVLCVYVISVFPEKSFLDEVKSLSTVIVNDIVYMHVYTYSGVGTGEGGGQGGHCPPPPPQYFNRMGGLPPPPIIRTQYTSYQY